MFLFFYWCFAIIIHFNGFFVISHLLSSKSFESDSSQAQIPPKEGGDRYNETGPPARDMLIIILAQETLFHKRYL